MFVISGPEVVLQSIAERSSEAPFRANNSIDISLVPIAMFVKLDKPTDERVDRNGGQLRLKRVELRSKEPVHQRVTIVKGSIEIEQDCFDRHGRWQRIGLLLRVKLRVDSRV